ncbi:MAG TPA: hypothetical protein VJ183_12105 [Chloroflexia bacterium]|nr:hypothetical protein [Chloroflexia bacterium]
MFAHKNHRRIVTLVAYLTIALVLIGNAGSNAFAYQSGSKYFGTLTINYYIDPNLGTGLGTSGAVTAFETGATKWNTMRVNLVRTLTSTHPNQVTYRDLVASPPCPLSTPENTFAVNCVTANPTSITNNKIYFNSNTTYFSWNTSGTTACSGRPWPGDVQAIATHESGHSMFLGDNPAGHSEAVMSFNCSTKRELQEDDKHGATMLYGVRTNWETGFADGQLSRIAPNLALNVTGYDPGLSPELGPVFGEFGVTPFGSKYERMAGKSLNNYSYVYFTLFTAEDDSGTQQNWFTIRPDTHLRWFQYNFQQSTMSVDLRLRDASGNQKYIRDDSSVVDQSGVRAHPAARGVYNTGQWYFFDVNLGSFAAGSWKIDRWMLAYDNGNSGAPGSVGQFRAYFDNVRVEYTP